MAALQDEWDVNTHGQGRGNRNQIDLDLPVDVVSGMLKDQRKILAELIEVAPNEKERQNVKNRLESLAVKLIRNFMVSDSREQMMKDVYEGDKLKERVTTAINDKEVMDILSQFKAKYETAESSFVEFVTDEVVKNHKLYVEHHQELTSIFEDFDRETETRKTTMVLPPRSTMNESVLGESEDFVPTVDPVTQGLLIDPVKNKICGHVYGKKSILQIIATNKKARCPYAGCSSKEFVHKSHLTRDVELSKKIAAKVDEAQNRKENKNQQTSKRREKNSVVLDE